MSGEVNTNVYKDPYGNTAESIKYHSDGSEIKNGITTFADPNMHAVVYDGTPDISVFLDKITGKKYSEEQINEFIINADRQNDDIEYNGTRSEKLVAGLEVGDVIILDSNNVKKVNQYKLELKEKEQKEEINEKIKKQEEKIATMKKNAWSAGIGIAGVAATVGLAFVGWPWAVGAAALTGAVYGIRYVVNNFKEENAKLDELIQQQQA